MTDRNAERDASIGIFHFSHVERDVQAFLEAKELFADYVGSRVEKGFAPVSTIIREGKEHTFGELPVFVPVVVPPPNDQDGAVHVLYPPAAIPVDAQGLTADDIKEDRNRIRDLKFAYDNAKFVVYTWLKQQCTPSMIVKLKDSPHFEDIDRKRDLLRLWTEIESISIRGQHTGDELQHVSPVVMEKRCRKTNNWIGPTLHDTIYIDFTVDENLDRAVDNPAVVLPSKTSEMEIVSTKALEQLSTEEVVLLFKSLKICDVLDVIVKQSIAGEMLSFAEKEEDIRELLGITIPAVKIRLLLYKLQDYKVHGVPIKSITETVGTNQSVAQGARAAPLKGEEEAEVWHKNDIDPCDDSDLGYSYYVSIHDHPLYRNKNDNGWGCDGRNFQEGCACGCTAFYQTEGWVRFSCLPCSFDLCKGCVFKWILSEEEAVLATYDKEEFVIGETVFVSVHDHVLHRDRTDNGWACNGRRLPGGCRKGCTDYGQSAGWERFRCSGCDFDLCRECVRAYKTR